MQIVIEIPDEKYQWIKEHRGRTDYQITEMLYKRVRNGIPLPKGHGRLIDANYVTKDLNTLQDSFVINISNAKPGALCIACCAPTIIEADAVAESEDKK